MRFEEVTSRTFASLQSSCRHSCDIHKVLQEATERYRTRNCSLLFRRQHQDMTADSKRVSAAEPQRKWKNCSGKRLQHVKQTVIVSASQSDWFIPATPVVPVKPSYSFSTIVEHFLKLIKVLYGKEKKKKKKRSFSCLVGQSVLLTVQWPGLKSFSISHHQFTR